MKTMPKRGTGEGEWRSGASGGAPRTRPCASGRGRGGRSASRPSPPRRSRRGGPTLDVRASHSARRLGHWTLPPPTTPALRGWSPPPPLRGWSPLVPPPGPPCSDSPGLHNRQMLVRDAARGWPIRPGGGESRPPPGSRLFARPKRGLRAVVRMETIHLNCVAGCSPA